ncbi:MAG: FAD-dependent oxidoreductase, partial [Planctomycetota bacterium]|nr:FAD-dependent oxidoreductase [Planctomycetota bacterium]
MPILVRNLTLGLDEDETQLRARAAARLRIAEDNIRHYAVVRRSIDARRRGEVAFVYNVELALDGGPRVEQKILRGLRRSDVAAVASVPQQTIEPGDKALADRPVIVGFGPAGMFAALWLAQRGYRPLVLERGRDVQVRHRDVMQRLYREHVFDPESNLLFGEGGAGAYSDGKLYTRVNDPRVRRILQIFVDHGATPDILIDGRPHLGSDRIPTLCRRIRQTIESLGGEIRFGHRLDELTIDDGAVKSIRVGDESFTPGPLLLGIGHSARDTIRMLAQRGVTLEAKAFQLGVRVEHPQELVNRWQYGDACGHPRLPPAEYHLVAKGAADNRGDVYSFCMCPGGIILPTNESPGLIATNGASNAGRSNRFANGGLVLTIGPEEVGHDPIAGLAFVEKWERIAYELTNASSRVPCQRAPDFLAGKPSDGRLETSYPLGGAWADVRELLPKEITTAIRDALQRLDRRMPGFAGTDCLVTGPESRASAPVRIVRDPKTRESV